MTVVAEASVESLQRRLAATIEKASAAESLVRTPALDARLLLAHALGVEPSALALRGEQPVPAEIEERAAVLVGRRISGEPVARIIGRQEFWSLELEIGPDVLVPRADTETLVQAALDHIDRCGRRNGALRVLDLGTGSGAILLALLSELPSASGVATECLEGALDLARRNARRLGFESRVRFVVGDWARAVEGRFDVVVANPPYIRTGEIAGLEIEVCRFDPHIALDGGADGLDAYRAIFGDLDRLLKNGGHGFFEIGFDQAVATSELAERHGFTVRFHRDLAGIERVAELRRVVDS